MPDIDNRCRVFLFTGGGIMKKVGILAIVLASAIISFTGCKKSETESKKQENMSLPPSLRELDDETAGYISEKSIVVVLGYGFNDDATVEKIKADLDSDFSLKTDEKDGFVSLYVFPNDFMSGKYARISKLESMVEDSENVAGLLIFGAPEKTHKTLAELMDKEDDGKLHFPVVSFFPQDDILGIQYTSDIVIDYAGNSESVGDLEGEAVHTIPNFDTRKVISNTIMSMIARKSPFEKDENLINTAQDILGKEIPVSRYVDSETKIQALNHFTFE
jgi:hypothetical protein